MLEPRTERRVTGPASTSRQEGMPASCCVPPSGGSPASTGPEDAGLQASPSSRRSAAGPTRREPAWEEVGGGVISSVNRGGGRKLRAPRSLPRRHHPTHLGQRALMSTSSCATTLCALA